MQIEPKPADVWFGEDPKLRELMTKCGLLAPEAPDFKDVNAPDLSSKVVGGEVPPWSSLPSLAGVIERVPATVAETDVSAVEGFASYRIEAMGDLTGLDARAQIAGIATSIGPEEGARLREQLALSQDVPVWPEPTKRDVRWKHIAVAGDLPLAIAMFAASCTIARPVSPRPGEHEITPVTFAIRWQRFFAA